MPRNKRPHTGYARCVHCAKPTAPWSRYCRSHQRRLRVHGHPLARPVPLRDLLPFVVRVRAVLERNREHRGIQLAVREIEALLEDALRRDAEQEPMAPDYVLWAGLAHRGVTAFDVLGMVFGAVAYESLGGNAALDQCAYQHRVARAALALDALKGRTSGGTPKELGATGQRKLGQFLLAQYSALAIGVVDQIKGSDQKARARYGLMTLPLH